MTADLQKQLDQRTCELAEALEQQTATSEILGILARSPTDVQSVLDAVCQSAARLCPFGVQTATGSSSSPFGARSLKPNLFRWSATIPRAERFSINGLYILLTCKRRWTNFL